MSSLNQPMIRSTVDLVWIIHLGILVVNLVLHWLLITVLLIAKLMLELIENIVLWSILLLIDTRAQNDFALLVVGDHSILVELVENC
jgi:hypothetical protein